MVHVYVHKKFQSSDKIPTICSFSAQIQTIDGNDAADILGQKHIQHTSLRIYAISATNCHRWYVFCGKI